MLLRPALILGCSRDVDFSVGSSGRKIQYDRPLHWRRHEAGRDWFLDTAFQNRLDLPVGIIVDMSAINFGNRIELIRTHSGI